MKKDKHRHKSLKISILKKFHLKNPSKSNIQKLKMRYAIVQRIFDVKFLITSYLFQTLVKQLSKTTRKRRISLIGKSNKLTEVSYHSKGSFATKKGRPKHLAHFFVLILYRSISDRHKLVNLLFCMLSYSEGKITKNFICNHVTGGADKE